MNIPFTKLKKLSLSLVVLFLVHVDINSQMRSSNKMNVLLIIADDLNCAIGAYGDSIAHTPNIDKLAKRGVMFTNAHVQYPLCGPSRVSMMTGLYPDQTKSKKLRLYVRQTIPDVITLGQKFRMENYHSIRVGKIFHYHNPRDIGTAGHDDSYSWDRTVNPYGLDKIEEHKLIGLKPILDGGTLSWMQADGQDYQQTDGIGASATIDFLNEFAESGESFFLAYGLYRPHVPFVAPKSYYDRFNINDFYIDQNNNDYLQSIPLPAALSVRAKKEQIELDNYLAKTIKCAYYATTSFVDAQVGRVLKKLEETGLDKNTIIIFTSDHGYHLGEHGHWQKQTLFELSTRVPLIISGPGINENFDNVDAPVELIDIYPTIMELLNIEGPQFLQGKSLKPYLDGSKSPIRNSALTELELYTDNGLAKGYSIRTDRYRLSKWTLNGNTYFELYDHENDSQELNNLSSNLDFSKLKDSLNIILNKRITNAKRYPKGLGRQFKNASPFFEPKRIIHKQK